MLQYKYLTTPKVMQNFGLALVPGITALLYVFDARYLFNILLGAFTALLVEGLVFYFRKQPISGLQDLSALICSTLLVIALPPSAPWWMIIFGVSVALLLGKHAYGGLGLNLFNPAMVGYVVLLLSFPSALAQWEIETVLDTALHDAVSQATPLELIHIATTSQYLNLAIQQHWLWINMSFFFGGLYLIFKHIITYHIPLGILLGIFVTACLVEDNFANYYSHLIAGGTCLGAFFIATDPVTSPTNPIAKLFFGLMIGMITVIIRVFGAYPDGMAFSILLLNAFVPLLDEIFEYFKKP